MTVASSLDSRAHYAIAMPAPDDFDFWRDRARALVAAGIAPERVAWTEPGGPTDLFAQSPKDAPEASEIKHKTVRASRRFVALARDAILHSDRQRFAQLYLLLWRLQANPRLMEDKTDPTVRRVEDLAKAVRRDSHKMHAFVSFRLIEGDGQDVPDHYVAWFEPDHHIVRANAGFFMRRFANMKWSILTPKGCLHWDGNTMAEGPPAQRSDAPGDDPTEDLWRSYYASIFNPARLKVGAMLKEMPRKYWKNMPETSLIPELVAGAQQREARMVDAGELAFAERPATLDEIGPEIGRCRKCPIGALANNAVSGEGPVDAALMIVGEQPGDREDELGRPFVGPAGQLLDRQLERAGLDRGAAYVTNAVKHFKFVQRGKRRIHQSPTAREIDTCRWWLESERALVAPKVVLALGASAARSILGKTVSITKARGAPIMLEDGSELWITVHPSYLLRLDGDAVEKQTQLFADDLAAVRRRLDALGGP